LIFIAHLFNFEFLTLKMTKKSSILAENELNSMLSFNPVFRYIAFFGFLCFLLRSVAAHRKTYEKHLKSTWIWDFSSFNQFLGLWLWKPCFIAHNQFLGLWLRKPCFIAHNQFLGLWLRKPCFIAHNESNWLLRPLLHWFQSKSLILAQF